MKIGSLFSGVGGLDMGVMEALGGTVAWHAEFKDAPSRILAHHWPDVPNLGDVTAVDWSQALKALGNGVVPQQAAHAIRRILAWTEVAA